MGISHSHNDIPYYYKWQAAKAILAIREEELLKLKGPCRVNKCRLHYAHSGPCDIKD
jgi:hypothetical protein